MSEKRELETEKINIVSACNADSANKESVNKESVNKESANKESVNKESANKECANKESANKESANKENESNINNSCADNAVTANNAKAVSVNNANIASEVSRCNANVASDVSRCNANNLNLVNADNSKNLSVDNAPKIATKKERKKHFVLFFRGLNWLVKNFLLKVIYRPKMIGTENFVTDSRAIIVCNHYSAKDPFPVIGELFGENSKVLMKSELTENKFLARVFEELGTISIHRGESDITAIKKIISLLNNGGQLLIFPEGTRNKEGSKVMLPFKEGTATFAIKTKSPIIPMLYYKKPKFWHKNYLMIGKSFDLSEFYEIKTKESKEQATQKIVDKLAFLRIEVDEWVEKFGANSKKYIASKSL